MINRRFAYIAAYTIIALGILILLRYSERDKSWDGENLFKATICSVAWPAILFGLFLTWVGNPLVWLINHLPGVRR